MGLLGGLIGLGGAEFRLPLLIGLFGFAALSAVILNKAASLIVVLTALPARLATTSAAELASHWTVAANLLAGSLIGAWAGATWAVRMRSAPLASIRCDCPGRSSWSRAWSPGLASASSPRSWALPVASC